ncbi:MAG: hypothetical protein Kow0063_41860 [Anaerolineae bacterium]
MHVANTIFCAECGVYILEGKELRTEPIDTNQIGWGRNATPLAAADTAPLHPDQRSIRLRISACPSPANQPERKLKHSRELEIALIRPIRLGRMDPQEGVYPEIDLTDDAAKQHGVSREHACIFRRGDILEVEDLGSTNGTLLNGNRLAPYRPASLHNGDRLQLGNLLIEVSF